MQHDTTPAALVRFVVSLRLLRCSRSRARRGADLVRRLPPGAERDADATPPRARWARAQERIPQGRAGLLPLGSLPAPRNTTTAASASATPRTAHPTSHVRVRQQFDAVSVTQPLYRTQNTIVYEQALTQVEQADAQLALAAQDLILRVAQAYFDVLLAQDNVAFAEAQKTAIGQQLEQAKRNFEVGTATITDTHEAQARYDLTTAQEIAARNDLELRRRALEQLIGRARAAARPARARASR